jgi:hypothetical protein
MPRERRQKAQDVFRESKPIFGTTSSFEKAFPMVDELKVNVTEKGDGVYGASSTRSLGKQAGEYVDCSNPLCYNGGFQLGAILRDMTYARETQWSGSRMCQGYEGSPKGRKNYGPCWNEFEIAIEITYKKDAGPSQRPS